VTSKAVFSVVLLILLVIAPAAYAVPSTVVLSVEGMT
jgi:hypothetical protein